MRRLPGVTVSERVAIAEAVAERLGRRRKPVPLWPVAGSCVDRVHSPIQSAAKTDCRYIQISQCGKNRLSECTRIAHGYPENPHECWLIATVHHRRNRHAPGAQGGFHRQLRRQEKTGGGCRCCSEGKAPLHSGRRKAQIIPPAPNGHWQVVICKKCLWRLSVKR